MNSSEYKDAHKYYVGKNKYGLGFVKYKDSFYLPWVKSSDLYGYSDWYGQSHETLIIDTIKYTQEIKDIEYIIDQANIISTPPYAIKRTTVTNQQSNAVVMKSSIETTQTETNSWELCYSLSISVTTQVSAGIPILAEGKIETSAQTTFQFSHGKSFSESHTKRLDIEVNVPPNSMCGVTMQARKYTSDIPFKARLFRKYSSGVTKSTTLYGTYKGVKMGDYRGVTEKCEPLF